MKSVWFLDGTGGFSPHRLKEKPCGGIITSLTLIPQYLAKQGLDVRVLSNYEKTETVGGVKYSQQIPEGSPDVVVFNRNVINRGLSERFKSKKVWWLHDIVDPRYLDDDGFKSVDRIVALSKYNADSYSDFYGIDWNKFRIIPNGVDRSIFHNKRGKQNKHLFLCASAAIKGLYPVEFSYHNLKRMDPNIELRLYSSQKLHDLEDSESSLKTMQVLREQGVKVLDPIPQASLAEVMREARALLMPNHYPEICSNLLLQAQACGLPVVTVPIGSAPEFIEHGKTGLLTQTFPHDMFWWWKDYAKQCLSILKDDFLFERISLEAPKKIKSWEDIGKEWDSLLREMN